MNEEDLDPVAAVVLRADEPVPAHIVSDERNTFIKRLGLAVLLVLALAGVAIILNQSRQNGDALGTLKHELRVVNRQLRASTHERGLLRAQVAQDDLEQRQEHHQDILFFETLQAQNRRLVAAGLPPLNLSGLEPAPQPESVLPQPAPTPTRGGNNHHRKPSSGGSSTPEPTGSPSPTSTSIVCTTEQLLLGRCVIGK
jgi:hypothetical protein